MVFILDVPVFLKSFIFSIAEHIYKLMEISYRISVDKMN